MAGLTVAALVGLAAPSVATTVTQATSDAGGNRLVVSVYYDVSGSCARANHMTYKYTRNDGQFTASWNSGKIRTLAVGCSSGSANVTKNVSGPSTALLVPGNVYSRDFGTMPWTTYGGYFGLTGYAKIDLHRSTQPAGTVSGRLCAQAGTSGGFTGSDCGNF
jgi:hypothetical protein